MNERDKYFIYTVGQSNQRLVTPNQNIFFRRQLNLSYMEAMKKLYPVKIVITTKNKFNA